MTIWRLTRDLLLGFLIVMCSVQLKSQQLDFANLAEAHGMRGDYFHCIDEDQYGYIWIGTKGFGVYRWDGVQFDFFRNEQNNDLSLMDDLVYAITTLDDGRLLLGSSLGISQYNYKENSFSNLQISQPSRTLPDSTVLYFYEEEEQILVGLYDGMFIMDKDLNIKQYVELPLEFPGHTLYEQGVIAIIRDKRHAETVWLGTSYGLKKYNTNTGEIKACPNPPKWHDKNALNQQYAMYDIIQVEDGSLWMAACWSGGIMNYIPETEEWRQHLYPWSGEDDPYHGNSLHSLTQLNDTMLFYSNNRGGGFFDMKNEKMMPQSLPDYEFHTNHNSDHLVDRHGYVWIVGIEGIFRSNTPLHDQTKRIIPLPVLHGIDVNGSQYRVDASHSLSLPIDSNSLALQIGTINPDPNEVLKFEWKLEGHDDDWKSQSTSPFVYYPRLESGSYTFNYRVSSEQESLPIEGRKLDITIYQPYYITWWFLVGCIFGGVGLLILFIKWRTSVIRKEEEKKTSFEKRLAEVEMSALRAQMNPHFLFNTMNSINHYILRNDTDNASHYLTKFSRLVRQVLNNSKSKTVSLEDEVSALRLYVELEQLRFEDQFNYDLIVDDNIKRDRILIPPMLIQPYVENAIWHGLMPLEDKKGKLMIRIKYKDEHIQVQVEDNGIGRVASGNQKSVHVLKKKSLGMDITKDRIKTINQLYGSEATAVIQDLYEGSDAAGTLVMLHIPIISPPD